MNHASYYGLRPADRIIVPKSILGIIDHHIIYYGISNSIELFIENSPGHGVRYVTADNIFNEYNCVKRIEKFSGNDISRGWAVRRAESQIGKSYDLTNYNCESFCNYVQYGVQSSKQSEKAIAITGIFLGGVLLTELLSNHD